MSDKKEEHIYIAIDLKSFYASVECVQRGLDPLDANLVVADRSRTEKTICVAVSPNLKSYGISGRARLFEVTAKLREVNAYRRSKIPSRTFSGKSYLGSELRAIDDLEVDFIAAVPRMSLYMKTSAQIYNIYLRYVAPEDMHVYSVDEVFIDVTHYLNTYKLTPYELAMKMMMDVYKETGITATCGIGTNLYLCKVAMDVMAKHVEADEYGMRIAELNEESYRRLLWDHKPLTDFWRVGSGYNKKLIANGLYTMGDIARCSIGKTNEFYNEELLYKLFGINAELLIDHAWGYEPVTISDIKNYKPESKCVSSGQVLHCAADVKTTRLIVWEMADQLALDLVDKKVTTNQIVLTVGYDIDNLTDDSISYSGEVKIDRYGRKVPKHAHGTKNLSRRTSSSKIIIDETMELFDRIVNPNLLARRINITANNLLSDSESAKEADTGYEQLDLFSLLDDGEGKKKEEEITIELDKEHKLQEAMLSVKKKFGKNAVLKGTNLVEGATMRERNNQIGGHKA